MPEDTLMLILVICGPAALVISIYTGLRIFMILKRIRKESSKSYEIASRIEQDYEILRTREAENRQRLNERFDAMDSELRERMELAEKIANGTRERLVQLETYLKEFFEVELKAVFESFDRTVTSILEEMKAELLRGVDRIEEIQAVVDSKTFAQDRILDGEGSVYRMISETKSPAEEVEAELDADLDNAVSEPVENKEVAGEAPEDSESALKEAEADLAQ